MGGISSVYKDDSLEDTTTIVGKIIQRQVIHSIEVYTQDAEFELDNDFEELV